MRVVEISLLGCKPKKDPLIVMTGSRPGFLWFFDLQKTVSLRCCFSGSSQRFPLFEGSSRGIFVLPSIVISFCSDVSILYLFFFPPLMSLARSSSFTMDRYSSEYDPLCFSLEFDCRSLSFLIIFFSFLRSERNLFLLLSSFSPSL